jgi:lambda family phage portal protein
MGMIDKLLASVAPGIAVTRAQNLLTLDRLKSARYDAAASSKRTKSLRAVSGDADATSRQRAKLALISRDLVRNNPWAQRGVQIISNNVIGAGIIPKIKANSKRERELILRAVERHFDTTAIDADGRTTLYGLQRLVINSVAETGEALVRRRRRDMTDGFAMPFQVQLLEPDHLDALRDGTSPNGNFEVREGIEYDGIGRRRGYWLFDVHPGAMGLRQRRAQSRFIPASEVLHIQRQDRIGQMRGVSWFAPVALSLADIADYSDAQILRQKIAACFAAFRRTSDADGAKPGQTRSDAVAVALETITPGRIEMLEQNEEITFANPPTVDGYEEFIRTKLREVAAGLGITYESLTGDMSGVNFTSYKAARIEMNRAVEAWQYHLIIPQMLDPIAAWAIEGLRLMHPFLRDTVTMGWVPPVPQLISPDKEIPALVAKVRAGFASRSDVIREMGNDPERVLEELTKDAKDAGDLVFDTDAGKVSGAGVFQAAKATAAVGNGQGE